MTSPQALRKYRLPRGGHPHPQLSNPETHPVCSFLSPSWGAPPCSKWADPICSLFTVSFLSTLCRAQVSPILKTPLPWLHQALQSGRGGAFLCSPSLWTQELLTQGASALPSPVHTQPTVMCILGPSLHWSCSWYDDYLGFPGGISGKEPACQCGRHGFDPWVRKIPWRRKWQPATYSCLENPMGREAWRAYSPWGRKRVRHNWSHTHMPHEVKADAFLLMIKPLKPRKMSYIYTNDTQ